MSKKLAPPCRRSTCANQVVGANFPTVAGSNATHNRGVERKSCGSHKFTAHVFALESGNMLIMALAHARISGDGSLLKQHVSRLISVRRSDLELRISPSV